MEIRSEFGKLKLIFCLQRSLNNYKADETRVLGHSLINRIPNLGCEACELARCSTQSNQSGVAAVSSPHSIPSGIAYLAPYIKGHLSMYVLCQWADFFIVKC